METEVEVEKIVEVPVDRIVYQDKIIYKERESAVEVESLVYMEKIGKDNPRARLSFLMIFLILFHVQSRFLLKR